MKSMKTILVALMMVMAAGVSLADDAAPDQRLAARTFQFKFKDANRVASMIRPLLSSDGSVSIQANSLAVTDSPENLGRIADLIAQYDAPAREFVLDVKLVSASRSANPGAVPPELRDIAGKLSGVLRFNDFQKLGEMRIRGSEGDPALVELAGGFRADFQIGEFDPLSQSVRISEFKLFRVPAAGGELQQLLKTAVNLRVGQTVVLGASRLPDSQRALMLVMLAEPVK